jgi:hypothetical protein
MIVLNNPNLVRMSREHGFWYGKIHIKVHHFLDHAILTTKEHGSWSTTLVQPVFAEYLRQLKIWTKEQRVKAEARSEARKKTLAANKANSPWTAFEWRKKFLLEMGWYTDRVRGGSAFQFHEVLRLAPDAIDEKAKCFHTGCIDFVRKPLGRYEVKRIYSPESYAAAIDKVKEDMLKESKKEHEAVLKAIDAL